MTHRIYQIDDDDDEKSVYSKHSLEQLTTLYGECVDRNSILGSMQALDVENELFTRGYHITYTPQGEWCARKS